MTRKRMNRTVAEKTAFLYANRPVSYLLSAGTQFGVSLSCRAHSQVLRVVLESKVLPATTSPCRLPFFYSERVVFLPPPAPTHYFAVQLENQTTVVDASSDITLHEEATRRGGACCEPG